jgi:hypothetical protein
MSVAGGVIEHYEEVLGRISIQLSIPNLLKHRGWHYEN